MPKRTPDQFLAMSDEDLDVELENMPMTESCDVIRRRIRTVIDNGEMKVGELQRTIGVTSTAYSRFMGQNGPYKGAESSVYSAAWAFFKKREMRGIKTIKKRKTASSKAAAGADDGVPSAEGIVLDGEMEGEVPVFDTCDEIRRKINAHLKLPSMTQATFLRCIGAQYHPEPKRITSTQLSTFRSKKGPYAGSNSSVFYGAYVYFEKLRIKQEKPKSKMRQEMEGYHRKGLDWQGNHDRVFVMRGEDWHWDKYARLIIEGPRGTRVCK